MKKILSLVLAIIMIASMAAVIIIPTSAEEPTTAYASYYTGNKDFSWYGEEYDELLEIHIPDDPTKTEYTLMSADQFAAFVQIVNNEFNQFHGITIKLGVDIIWNTGTFTVDENGDPLYNGVAPEIGKNVFEYIPIGDREACQSPSNTPHNSASNLTGQFYGSFDGQGHTVSGLYYDKPKEGFVGFFSIFCGRELKNLSIVNSYFRGHSRCGIFAGFVVGAVASFDKATGEPTGEIANTFENLYTDSILIVDGSSENNSRSGGIFGMVRPMPDNTYPEDTDPATNGFTVVLKKCWFAGTIWATHTTQYNGGLVGLAAMDDNTNVRLDGNPQNNRDHIISFEDCLVTGTINNIPEPAAVAATEIRIGLIMGGIYRGEASFTNCVVALESTNINPDTEVTVVNAMGISSKHKFLPETYESTDDSGVTTIKERLGKGIVGYYESLPCEVSYNNVFFVPIGYFQKHNPQRVVSASQGTLDMQVISEEQPVADATLANAVTALGANEAFVFTTVDGKTVVSLKNIKTTVDPADPSVEAPDPSKVVLTTTTTEIIVTNPPKPTTATPTTATPETKAPVTAATEEKGCGGFTAIGAVLALVALTGAAIVIKKK